ncbi:stemmadenine O-acetyltransferase-like [Humulus lupulus]|uniref:stemmadenine O-acetyltransferase-like n=1 Tax=Humulus lupulus TaxID=3486 RepID=UPI002B401BE5|nr:stemmadenine O-acetyltransferase-like [Humulus lupulus]
MSNIEIEVLSTSIIKPSSPTPSHLRTHQLSFIDQLCGHIYNPSVLFYPPQQDINGKQLDLVEISNKLKQSLSEVLSWYYPLAGRLNRDGNDPFVDCNDEGVPYVEARVVNCKVSDIVRNPILHELPKFVPLNLYGKVDLLLGAQLTIFDCGGIAIASCVSHKVGDGLSALMFTKCWAAIARGEDHDNDRFSKMLRPHFVSSKAFPPRDISVLGVGVDIPMKNIVARRFVFEASCLEVLRSKYPKSQNKEEFSNSRRYSRIEALSALICTRYIATSLGFGGEKKRYAIGHAFNLRSKLDPPLLENSFGNISRTIVKSLDLDLTSCGEEEMYGEVVKQMRELMNSGKEQEFVRNLEKGIDQTSNFLKDHAEEFVKGELVSFNFTSLCRFPLYEDFGFGKPSWVATNPIPYKNLIVFTDNKSCDGVEVYIDMEEEDMARLERDDEFMSFVSLPAQS